MFHKDSLIVLSRLHEKLIIDCNDFFGERPVS